MRLAFFIKRTTFHKGYGGLETQSKTLCEGLVKLGYSVTVFSPSHELTISSQELNGVDYIFVPSVYKTITLFNNKDNWYLRSYEAFLKEHSKTPFDVVVSQSSAGLGVIKSKRDLQIPVIAITHGSIISELDTRLKNIYSLKDLLRLIPDVGFSLYNFFYRQREFVHGADKIVSVSNYVKDSLINETYADESKFVVINNGAHIPNLSQSETDQTKLIYVGQIIRDKGVDFLLDIMQDPRLKECGLDIIGDGPYLEILKASIKQRGLENRVLTHGKMSHEELMTYNSRACAFLFPTKRIEGFPMVLAEALGLGVPVVAFNLGGVSDAVINDKTGILVSYPDIKSFINGVVKLVSDAKLRNFLSENARITAQNNFSYDVMLQKYDLLFKEVKG